MNQHYLFHVKGITPKSRIKFVNSSLLMSNFILPSLLFLFKCKL